MDMVVLHDIYIEIDSKGNFIRTMEYGGKKHREGIYSPITQNERHMEILKECRAEDKGLLWGVALRGTFHHFYKSLVVLANPMTVVNDRYAKKEIKEQVLRVDQLITTIKRMVAESRELSSSKKEILTIAEKLLGKNKEERKDYLKKYDELINEISPEDKELPEQKLRNTKICPKCGAELIIRTAKKGEHIGQQFYGCENKICVDKYIAVLYTMHNDIS